MTWIQVVPRREASGALAAAYARIAARPMPSVYAAPHGDAPGIIQVHSLDPALMLAVFGFSGTLTSDDTLPWAKRELISTITSRANQCFY